MSEENKVAQPTNENTEATTTEATETKTEETKTFTQSQIDNMIASRVMAERNKYEKKIAEEETKKQELLKQKELEEAKSKQEVEKIMQQRLAEKEAEINKIKSEVKAERIDKQILALASTNKAINPDQVVSLLKSEVQLSEDNRVEVLDQNGNIRYNEKGQPLSVEERVKEFLDTNPHFRQGSLSGSGSQSSIGGNSQKPRSIGDLDLNNPSDRKVYAEMRKQRQGFTLNPKLTINN
tara:strand:+ start:4015 stop:4725 length:711 start_codon:yes stop_codon:yes gene_type:complete